MADEQTGNANQQDIEKKPPDNMLALKRILSAESVAEQFKNALRENSGLFVSSVIDLVGSDKVLSTCNPGLVVKECLKAATLKLPINRNLGMAWIIPYKHKGNPIPQFQIGYKGYIQLALRTGQFRYLNCGMIYEGESVEQDKLTGEVEIFGSQTSDVVLGYFAHMTTINGFRKTIFWSKTRITEHAEKYSKSWGRSDSAWSTEFDKMAMKTLIKELLSKWGVMSVELSRAFESDNDDMAWNGAAQREADEHENSKPIDINPLDDQTGDPGESSPSPDF